jgi:lipopolysaccharide cholinephosphotransferase
MEKKLHNYTEEQLQKMQRINLEMATIFFEFCKEHNLTAYLCGGGCIGSIRHKGFVPWDDDLDFFMPREDYEYFVAHWDEYEPGQDLALSVQDENHIDRNLFATLRHRRTTYIKPYQKDLDIVHGVPLDILPLDGYPDSRWKRKLQCLWALIYSLFCAQTVPENHGGVMALGSRILLALFRGKKIRYKIWSFAKRKMTKYRIADCQSITELCSGPGYMKNRYDRAWFEKYIEVPFADRTMPIPVGYDQYLRTVFGDYMQMPPEEDRVAHHDFLYLDLDRPYTSCREVDLKKLQQKCLEITMVFKEFCERHNLLFYLCGGGCIGAVRHGGFIPWDDDIDVFMPREDYEKMCCLWKEEMDESRYKLSRSSEEHFERSQLTAITDERTTFIKERQMDLDIAHGVRLEVLPLDGCPSGRWKRKMQLFWGLIYQIYINQEPPTSKGKLLEAAGKIMLALCPGWKNRYRMAMFAERQMTKYPIAECDAVTELCVRYNYMVNEYPSEIFASAVYKEFEGEMLPLPAGYETYLKMAFGNYMELPPQQDQVPSHDGICIDLENNYRKYRGVYYPMERKNV